MLHPAPTHLQVDTGPEFAADGLQEWRLDSSSDTTYIDLGSP
jgi:putative transposase